MAATTHLYEIFINAPIQRVWDALTDPAMTTQYFHGTRLESSFDEGSSYRYVVDTTNEDAVDGVIEVFEPPSRLVMTWHVLYDTDMAEEPASRVEWRLSPMGDDGAVTRVTVRHGDLALSPKTWSSVKLGWVQVVDGLKTLLETGHPLPSFDLAGTEGPGASSDTEGDWHRSQAVSANNAAWEYLDGRQHTATEADKLLTTAYAAAFHWQRASGSTAVHLARASWLLSRAHAVLGHGEVALHHAKRSAAHLAAAGDQAADFDHAYGAEAQARALACLGRNDEAKALYQQAATTTVSDPQDREIFEGDLHAEPWFGLHT